MAMVRKHSGQQNTANARSSGGMQGDALEVAIIADIPGKPTVSVKRLFDNSIVVDKQYDESRGRGTLCGYSKEKKNIEELRHKCKKSGIAEGHTVLEPEEGCTLEILRGVSFPAGNMIRFKKVGHRVRINSIFFFSFE